MENNEKTTQGGHPQVPTPKPPDRDDQGNSQPSENEEIPLNGAEVPTEAMSEGSSEDEMPMQNALEQQPLATTKNGVSLPIKSAGDRPALDVADLQALAARAAQAALEVLDRDHTGDKQPLTVEKNGGNLPIKSASDPGGDHVGTADGGPGVISRDHVGTTNHGPGETASPSAPDQESGKPPKSRNLEKQEAKVSKRHFDKSMKELINAIKDLANEQHTDNLKIEAGVGVTTQISQDSMQLMAEFEEKIKESHVALHDKIVLVEDKICSTQNSANGAYQLATDVKTSINGMAEAVNKCERQLAVYTRVGERLEGFLKENQSPRVRQDSKRMKRVRDRSPAPENGGTLEREDHTQTMEPTPMVQTTPQNGGTQSAARQSAAPPGTVLQNGSLATTMIGPNGNLILRKPGTHISEPNTVNSATLGARPRQIGLRETVRRLSNNTNTLRTVTDGTFTTTNVTPTLRLPRPSDQGSNQNANRNGSTRPKQNTYANIAAASASTVPGLNLDSQRNHHTQNNRGANRGPNEMSSGADKQPLKVRQDQYSICPNTGNVKRVEAYKTVPHKSDKQKGKENNRHFKNLNQVMCELVLFMIPTKQRNGDMMTKEQDRARITKFLRELKNYGYIFKNGDVVGSVRQWKNTRHPDFIPITITFCDEETRYQAEEAALEGGLKGHRTPREGDEQYDRIGFVRRSLSERERKELKLRREKRDSPAGVAFAEIKRREENSRTNQDDWNNYDVEGDEDPILAAPINDYMVPAANHVDPRENNNNQAVGGAMAEENLLQKMEEMQKELERVRAQKDRENRATVEANRRAEAEATRRTREAEAARRIEETEDESDWEFRDPIASDVITFRGNNGHTVTGPRNIATNFFATEPQFNYTENLNLARPSLSNPEGGQTQENTPIQSGNDSSSPECEYE